jgi:plastocyanin
MQSLKLGFVILASTGLLFLGACGNQASESNSNSSVPTSETTTKTEPTTKSETVAKTESSGHSEANRGGQVVESGAYHLEFVPQKEDNGTHIDFYVQKGDNHEAIPNAKVTAQVQIPDGSQKTLNLTYDKEGKHYTVLLPEKASGEYQVKMLVDVDGKKVDGRFSFKN